MIAQMQINEAVAKATKQDAVDWLKNNQKTLFILNYFADKDLNYSASSDLFHDAQDKLEDRLEDLLGRI